MASAEALAIASRLAKELARPTSQTLYEIEEDLQALLDTSELVTPEQEEEFRVELARTLQTTVEKRDRCAAFLAHCATMQIAADAEIKRLSERKWLFQKAEERMRKYVAWVIEQIGTDAKGKYKKLEGKTSTLAIRACPASVDITDEATVPSCYKTLTITVSAKAWEAHINSHLAFFREVGGHYAAEIQDLPIFAEIKKTDVSVSRTAIKKAIDAGEQVPGADLLIGKTSLYVS